MAQGAALSRCRRSENQVTVEAEECGYDVSSDCAPVFADGGRGWNIERGIESVTGATAGYLFGCVVAAGLTGYTAERCQDRTFAAMFTGFFAGSIGIYLFGVIGLMITADMTLNEAIGAGVVPFLVGDLIKAAAAGILLPGAWRPVGDAAPPQQEVSSRWA